MRGPRDVKRTLLTGLFIIGPFSLTFLLLAWFVSLIDRAVQPLVGVLGHPVPGLGLVIAFGVVMLAGIIGSNMVGQHALGYLEEFLMKIPVFNWLYRTIKQMSEVFSPEGKATFRGVVLVEFPRPGCYQLGLVTNEILLSQDGVTRKLLSIYVPTNHMYIGDTILLPQEQVVFTQMTQQDAIQAAISAGAALPATIAARQAK